MPATTTRILLSHTKWDKQELLDKLTDEKVDEFFERAHVLNPFSKKPKRKTAQKKITCSICFGEFSKNVSFQNNDNFTEILAKSIHSTRRNKTIVSLQIFNIFPFCLGYCWFGLQSWILQRLLVSVFDNQSCRRWTRRIDLLSSIEMWNCRWWCHSDGIGVRWNRTTKIPSFNDQ